MKTPLKGWTILHAAVWVGRKDLVEKLIALDVNVFATNNEGKTAADLAEELGDTEMLSLLKSRGRGSPQRILSDQQSVTPEIIASELAQVSSGVSSLDNEEMQEGKANPLLSVHLPSGANAPALRKQPQELPKAIINPSE